MKKLLEILKKLLGSKSGNSSSGFTLIELLIVIAIIGILAGGLLLAIDPAEKIRQGNDTRAINDVAQTANLIEQFAISKNDGVYPAAGSGATVPASIGAPKAPTSSYTYTYTVTGNTFTLRVASLQSKKYRTAPNDTPGFIYDSAKGKSCFGAAGITGC